MNILLAGDTHAHINILNRIIKKLASEGIIIHAIIQVGDFGFWEKTEWMGFRKGVFKFKVPTYVVHGNHEDPALVQEVMGKYPERLVPNFRLFMPGEVIEICGLKVMGVGGAKCVDDPKVFYPYDPQDYTRALDSWWWAEEPKIDLLVTHEAPRGTGMLGDPEMSEEYNLDIADIGEQAINELWEYVRPELQINGHHHQMYEHTTPSGLRHLTLPCIEDGYAILNTETMKVEIREEKN